MKYQDWCELDEIVRKPGWKVYQDLLKDNFDKAYKDLRACNLDRVKEIQGLLNGLEIALKVAQSELDEGFENNEEQ